LFLEHAVTRTTLGKRGVHLAAGEITLANRVRTAHGGRRLASNLRDIGLYLAANVILDAGWRPNPHGRIVDPSGSRGADRTDDVTVTEIPRATDHCHPPFGRFLPHSVAFCPIISKMLGTG